MLKIFDSEFSAIYSINEINIELMRRSIVLFYNLFSRLILNDGFFELLQLLIYLTLGMETHSMKIHLLMILLSEKLSFIRR